MYSRLLFKCKAIKNGRQKKRGKSPLPVKRRAWEEGRPWRGGGLPALSKRRRQLSAVSFCKAKSSCQAESTAKKKNIASLSLIFLPLAVFTKTFLSPSSPLFFQRDKLSNSLCYRASESRSACLCYVWLGASFKPLVIRVRSNCVTLALCDGELLNPLISTFARMHRLWQKMVQHGSHRRQQRREHRGERCSNWGATASQNRFVCLKMGFENQQLFVHPSSSGYLWVLLLISFIVIGEAKNLLPRSGNGLRDIYCTINLDREEIFRTSVADKTLK